VDPDYEALTLADTGAVGDLKMHSRSLLCAVRPALGKTSIEVHQWTAKQFWVDRQSFKQQDIIYCLEKV
jgi:hypothetical protein